MVDGTTGARRWDLPAPVTVTDLYLLETIKALEAIEAQLETVARKLDQLTPPAPDKPTARPARKRSAS